MLNIISLNGRWGAVCSCSICKATFEVKDRYIARTVHAGDQCDACKNLPRNPPTQALLHQIYNYDPDTGLLTYKRDFARRHKGADPTSIATNQYLVVTLDKTYLAHRVIWLMQTGDFPEYVDHINHQRQDNRWLNLRSTTRQANDENKSINKNNGTGYLGVSQIKSTGRFRASITRNHKQIHIGVFDTAEEAHQARLIANQEHGFHPNHGQ